MGWENLYYRQWHTSTNEAEPNGSMRGVSNDARRKCGLQTQGGQTDFFF
jgi:hypothetical protein